MPPETKTFPLAVIQPVTALLSWNTVQTLMSKAANLHWADSSEGASILDFIPNPKRYLIGELVGFKLALDCGDPGMGIRPPE
jgi:hypothetical protein